VCEREGGVLDAIDQEEFGGDAHHGGMSANRARTGSLSHQPAVVERAGWVWWVFFFFFFFFCASYALSLSDTRLQRTRRSNGTAKSLIKSFSDPVGFQNRSSTKKRGELLLPWH
jgi:hypothetical protein